MTKVDAGEKIAVTSSSGVKKDHTFSLIAHDGVRFLKLVLMMPNQLSLIKDLHVRNKFLLKSGFVDRTTERGTTMILVDNMDQIQLVYSDKRGSE